MKTIRTLSNVSYNSLSFFSSKILELEQRNIIEWCYWVEHKAEEDEEKDHIHFVFKPCSRIDTMDFRQLLFEYEKDNNLPLTCTKKFLPCNSIDDWLLYAVHDTPYLRSKGQWRKYHYKFTDINATDKDSLKYDWDNINRNKYIILDWLDQAVKDNIPFYKLVQDGIVPMSQRAQYEFQYNALFNANLAEKLKETHRHLEHEELLYSNVECEQLQIDKLIVEKMAKNYGSQVAARTNVAK